MAKIRLESSLFVYETVITDHQATEILRGVLPTDPIATVRTLYESGAIRKIEAIKRLREAVEGLGLADAKYRVDGWSAPSGGGE